MHHTPIYEINTLTNMHLHAHKHIHIYMHIHNHPFTLVHEQVCSHTQTHFLYLIAFRVTIDWCRGEEPLVLLIARQRPESGGRVTVCCKHDNGQCANPTAFHVVPEVNTPVGRGIKCLALDNSNLPR